MSNLYPLVFLEGLTISLSLILTIGIQNAFVLKQGILRRNSFLIAIMCSSIDLFLITAGVYGVGKFLDKHDFLLLLFSWGGVLFLFCYGIFSFYSSFKTHALDINSQPQTNNIKKTILKILVVSLLNPSNYLEICVLMGSISTKFSDEELFSFVLGASTVSFLWFFSLSYGARFLRPIFENPIAWKILDFIVGCIMFIIAISFMNSIKMDF